MCIRDSHTCALLDDNTVRCWGFGGNGRLGYGNVANAGDDESPGSVGPVDLGPGRTALAITAGGAHSCALLDDHTVRCWGHGFNGALGYGGDPNNSDPMLHPQDIGNDETPGSIPPVNLGAGRTATAISAGQSHT